MWIANLEDGSSKCSKDTYWTDLPKDQKITGVVLSHPQWLQKPPRLHLCLNGMDQYFFSRHARAMLNQQPAIEAESIGGVNQALGIVTEVRLDYTGNVSVTLYPFSEFRYSPSILRQGAGKKD